MGCVRWFYIHDHEAHEVLEDHEFSCVNGDDGANDPSPSDDEPPPKLRTVFRERERRLSSR